MDFNWYKCISSSLRESIPTEEDKHLGFKDIGKNLTDADLSLLNSRYSFSDFFKAGGEGAAFIDSKTGHIVKITTEIEEYENALKIMGNETIQKYFVPVYDAYKLDNEYGIYVIEEGYASPLSSDEYFYVKYIHSRIVALNFSSEIFSDGYKEQLAEILKYSTKIKLDKSKFYKIFDIYINLINGIYSIGFNSGDNHEDNVGWYEGKLVRFDFSHL